MADIVLFKDLKDFEAKMVFINGEPVAKDGKALFPLVNRVDKAVTHSVNIKPVTSSDLKIPLKKDMVRVIGLDKYSLNTVLQKRKVKIVQGCFEVSPEADIKKLFVIERHNATGKIGKALIENYGIRNGAIGTTIAHDSHNIIVSGDNDRDILAAIRELENAGADYIVDNPYEIMELIQNAYQGFAKQNYTMLDNLKLGYGGTQAEMARLINDSGVLGDTMTVTAETVNQVSFDKMIEAIHVIQDEMGITGTTSKEAASTITGSLSSAKSAWENFLSGAGGIDAVVSTFTAV